MLKYSLLALPLAMLVLLCGCDESNQGYAGAKPSSTQGSAAASPAAPAPAPSAAQAQATPPPSSRFSTTQSLPQGYGYVHEQDLTGGRITPPGASTQPYIVTQPQAAPRGS